MEMGVCREVCEGAEVDRMGLIVCEWRICKGIKEDGVGNQVDVCDEIVDDDRATRGLSWIFWESTGSIARAGAGVSPSN